VPLRVCKQAPYRLFGSPVPLRRCFRSPLRFSGACLPHPCSMDGSPLTGFVPLQRHPSGWPPFAATWCDPCACSRLPPLGFRAPPATSLSESVCCPVPPGHHPSSTFLRSMRVCSSLSFVALFHATAALGVSLLRAFPHHGTRTGLVDRRYPLDVFAVFPGLSAFLSQPASPGRFVP
jgi:hypothetical protein